MSPAPVRRPSSDGRYAGALDAAAVGTSLGQGERLREEILSATLNQRANTSFKEELAHRTTAAVQRCMDAGLAADAALVALDVARRCTARSRCASTSPTTRGRPWRSRSNASS